MNLTELHKDFDLDLRRIVSYHGVRPYDAQDIYNDFYIDADNALKNGKAKRIYKDGVLNKPYLFTMIKGIIFRKARRRKLFTEQPVEEFDVTMIEPEDKSRIGMMRKAILDIPYHFDRQLITVFLREGFTIRGMADEVGISPTTVFHSMTRSKDFIKTKILKHEDTIKYKR